MNLPDIPGVGAIRGRCRWLSASPFCGGSVPPAAAPSRFVSRSGWGWTGDPVRADPRRAGAARPTGSLSRPRPCPGPVPEPRRPKPLALRQAGGGQSPVHCHAGCETKDVVAAVGLELADLFDDNGNGHRDEEAVYRYVAEDGKPLFEVVRFEGKRFAQRTPDGRWGLNGARRVLYRLPRVLEAVRKGERIYIPEGEKDVHALERLGLTATTNPGGAGKWRSEYSDVLRGAKVTVIADRDEAGYDHARQVATALQSVVSELEVVESTRGKDVSDHLTAQGTIAELVELDGFRSFRSPLGVEPNEPNSEDRSFGSKSQICRSRLQCPKSLPECRLSRIGSGRATSRAAR